jgi:hypothetical protein
LVVTAARRLIEGETNVDPWAWVSDVGSVSSGAGCSGLQNRHSTAEVDNQGSVWYERNRAIATACWTCLWCGGLLLGVIVATKRFLTRLAWLLGYAGGVSTEDRRRIDVEQNQSDLSRGGLIDPEPWLRGLVSGERMWLKLR